MPTIKDIARECGVSANTVSSVLNNKPGEVSEKTRDRILEAMQRLDYRPNAAARRMTGKRLNTIGIADRFSPGPDPNPYNVQILDTLFHTARGRRWDVLYYSGYPSEDRASRFPTYAYLDGRCDGLLCFTGGFDQKEAEAIVRTGLPVVFIGETLGHLGGAVIDIENEFGAYLATQHLIDLGHTRIGMMQGLCTSGNAERVAGYRRALAEQNIPVDETLLYPTWPAESIGYAQSLPVLAQPASERPTAIFCFNDTLAFGLLRAADELGIQVPEQLSIVGFDDVIPAASTTPPLTTVRQPLAWIGQRAVEMLIGIVEGRLPLNTRETVAPELIVRASTAPASTAPVQGR